MTCIVGLETENGVYIGGDSASVAGSSLQKTKLRKVFNTGEFLIGYTSSFRMGQLLQYQLSVEKQKDIDDLKYLVTKFIPTIRTLLKDGGYTQISENREEAGFFLLGYKGKLYEVDCDFQVNCFIDGIASVGAGAKFIKGALVAYLNEAVEERESILSALEDTSEYNAYVEEPFIVEFQKKERK